MVDINEPAFPETDLIECSEGWKAFTSRSGMTLRDWFAGQALAGLIGNQNRGLPIFPTDCAKYVYNLADALMAQRKRTE